MYENITYEPITCYHWPTGCSKHQNYVHAVPLLICTKYNTYTTTCCYAVVLLLFFWNYDARYGMQQRSASDGRACFVWGVEHWDAFYKGFQWYRTALFGRKKKRSRLNNWPIFDPDLDWRDRPPKPSILSRDFPKDCNLFRAIQSQSPSLI